MWSSGSLPTEGASTPKRVVERPDTQGLFLEGEVLVAEIDGLVGAGEDMVGALEQVTVVDHQDVQRCRRPGPQGLESANRVFVRLQRPVGQDGTVAKRGDQ